MPSISLKCYTNVSAPNRKRPLISMKSPQNDSAAVTASVTAIVPARNEEETIAVCARSLARQPEIVEILIVDDALPITPRTLSALSLSKFLACACCKPRSSRRAGSAKITLCGLARSKPKVPGSSLWMPTPNFMRQRFPAQCKSPRKKTLR